MSLAESLFRTYLSCRKAVPGLVDRRDRDAIGHGGTLRRVDPPVPLPGRPVPAGAMDPERARSNGLRPRHHALPATVGPFSFRRSCCKSMPHCRRRRWHWVCTAQPLFQGARWQGTPPPPPPPGLLLAFFSCCATLARQHTPASRLTARLPCAGSPRRSTLRSTG